MPFRNLKNDVPVIEKASKMPYYPVSLQQEGVYLQSMLNSDDIVWNTSHSWRFQGNLNREAFRNAVHDLISRQASLRTNFRLHKEKIYQSVQENIPIDSFFKFVDLSGHPGDEAQKEAAARDIEEQAAKKPYHMESDPLIRFILIRLNQDDHVIVISKHHIISDVTTRRLLLKELVTLYNAYVSGKPPHLEALEIQYYDYAVWQQEFLNSSCYQKQKEYWLTQFPMTGELPLLNFPTDFPRAENRRAKTALHERVLPQEDVSVLRSFGLRRRVTFSAPFLLAFYILLSQYSGQTDMIIGTLYRGRNIDKKALSSIIGLFANRIGIRLTMEGHYRQTPLGELLKKTDRQIRDAYENQDYLFEDLIRTIRPRRTASHAPVFQAVFNMLRVPAGEVQWQGLTPKEWRGFLLDTNISSQYDLSLYIKDDFKKITVQFLYPGDLFYPETAARISAQYYNILKQVLERPAEEPLDIEIITEEEKRQILYEFNDTAADYPKEKTIHQLFEEQAQRTPDAIALHMSHMSYTTHLTYKELNRKSDQLSSLLREKGVEPGMIVGLMLERSIEMIAAIYGILKTGAAYLPIDPGYPEQRITYMLKDSGAGVLLANLPEGHHLYNFQLLIVNCQLSMINPATRSPQPATSSSNPAYVIYTSGSTGKPKGVVIEHRAVHNFIKGITDLIDFAPHKTILALTTISFDIFVLETLLPLSKGLRVVVAHEKQKMEMNVLEELIIKCHVDMLQATPTRMQLFVSTGQSSSCLGHLQELMVGGEAFPPDLLEKLKHLTAARIYNMYGPTETTVWSAVRDLTAVEKVDIGRPIANTQIYILDQHDNLQPVGVAGELCIGGDGLSCGYLNKPELTAEKFNRSYRTNRTYIFYKTGDLARWLHDSPAARGAYNIEFLGRIDDQVKIRGFRIEPQEIESLLNKHQHIDESVVLARENNTGDRSLYAYVVPAAGKKVDVFRLRDYLAQKLPPYMVPSYFVKIDKIPLTQNGKVDRNALPTPGADEFIGPGTAYEPPQNDLQEKMVSVWQEVLGVERIGINDNFIAIGGDSIKAIQVSSRLSVCGYKLDIAVLFKHFTIKGVSPYVEKTASPVHQETVTGRTDLIPIQQWFLQQDFSHRHHWNQSVMVHREEGIEPQILEKVFERLLEHHDLLRAVLSPDGQALYIKEPQEVNLSFQVIGPLAEDNPEDRVLQEVNRLQQSIDLVDGPLIKACLFETKNGAHLFITAHHLVIDSVSWRVLFQDIAAGYEQAAAGKEITFPLKTHSYQQWAGTLKSCSRSGKLLQQYDYWKNICSAGKTPLFPTSKEEKGKLSDYYRYEIELDETQSRLLLNQVHHAYNTEINDILLSGLGLALRDCFHCDKVLIHLEGHGREAVSENIDVTRTAGWFTSLFPVLLDVQGGDDLSMHIRCTKETLRKIPNRGIGYGVLRYLSQLPGAQRDVLEVDSDICFNYMGRFDEDLVASGFKPSPFHTGHSRSPDSEQVYKININGMTVNSRLTFTVSADSRTFQTSGIETFAEQFKKNLQKIITHCAAVEETLYTPADFDAKELRFDELESILDRFNINNISKIYHLSPMQEGMLFHHLYDPDDAAYMVQLHYLLEGDVDPGVFQKSCEQLVRRQEVFRTAFLYKEIKRPVQVVLKEREAVFAYHDLADVQRLSIEERDKGFDLQEDPLIRFVLIKTGSRAYWLLVTYHHIIMDGWSTNLWLKDFLAIYKDGVLDTVYPYGTYLKWLEVQDFGMAHDYWCGYLEGFDQVTRLQSARPAAGDYLKQEYTIRVQRETNTQLSALAREAGVTLNNVLQGVWSVVLHRYAGSHDVVFGHVISGRNISLEGVEQVVGLFINTIPMRVKIDGGQSFIGMLRDIQDDLLESQQYGYLSLAEVQGHAALEGQVFDHLYVYENYPVNREITSQKQVDKVGFQLTRKYSIERTNYDLNIIILPREDLRIRLLYNGNIYDDSFISKLAGHIERVIEQVVHQPDHLVSDFELVTDEEKCQLLYEFNDTAADYPKTKTIHALFDEQAARTPDRMAVVGFFSNRTYRTYRTYKKLNEASNHLAWLLRKKGVKPGSIVAVMMGRSVERMVGIFAILKAGGAYLPIDPTYPEKRIEYILKDSGIRVLLTNLPEGHLSFNCQLSIVNCQLLMSSETQPAACSLQLATRLAYVIYTSGSTGKPKGVMVEHCPLVNRLNWMQKKYPIGAGDTILHKTPFTFDVSVWEIFWWSIVGARVCLLAPGGERDPKQMNEAIKKNRITVMHFVPSMLNIFLEYIKESGVKNIKYLSSLKQVIASGEALTVSMVRTFNRLLHKENGTLLANLYGPTEATIDVSFFDCPTVEEVEQVPIGKPIDNIQLLVLSKGNQLQPVGAAGELCIAGDGLARGYLNQPDLTAERFTGVHRSYRSYRTYISYRSYRTGDLARWLPEGNIEFLGRIDHQVKIRGNRIELGEIEAVLDKHPAIKESVVTAAADSPGDRHLCAYIVGKKSLTIEQLREHLEKALPDYMIPSYFVPIEKIPLTANGKVDRKSLPLPEPDKTIRISAKYEPPTNEIEEKLVILWQELLKKEKIGIHDNFFHLGGHSLKVMNLVAQIHKTFAVEIPMREIFDKPFAADIAKLIRDKEEKRKKLEQILQEIEGLSDDQVLELLK